MNPILGMSSHGSVLMECVIVLPLYFALFGGLFFLGEIAINRIRMNIGELAVTWMGGDRHGVNASAGSENGRDFGMDYLFQERFDSSGAYQVWQEQDSEEGDGRLNYYMTCYKGCVDFTVGIPDWIQGLLFAQDAMTGSKDELLNADGEESGVEWDAVGKIEIYKGAKLFPRSYSFHRVGSKTLDADTAEHMAAYYNRARTGARDEVMGWSPMPASKMLSSGTLLRVVSDKWIGTAGQKDPAIDENAVVSSDSFDVKRFLWQFGGDYEK